MKQKRTDFVSGLKASAMVAACMTTSVLLARVLRRMEQVSGLALGKGWGSHTVAQEVRAAISLLPTAAQRHPLVLDVGASTGDWAAEFLQALPHATIYCFEPSATAFNQLRRRFAGIDRVHTINAAVGDQNGQGQLWANHPGSGLGSLYRRRLDHIGIELNHSEEVQVVSLDTWLSAPLRPTILKMDVEGHEFSVLRGARRAMKFVQIVQFEFGACHIDSRTFFKDFFYYFQEAGFRLYRLGPKGLDPIQRYSERDEVFTITNILAQRI